MPASCTFAPPIDVLALPRTNSPFETRPAANTHDALTPPARLFGDPNCPLTRQSPWLAATVAPVAFLIVAPLPELGDKIALTAWNAEPYAGTPPDPGRGIVATCTRFDAAEFTAFVKTHRYRGGERFPKSTLARKQ